MPRSTSWARDWASSTRRSACSSASSDDALRLLARVVADVLGELLGGEQRVLQDRLALAVLVEQRPEVLELLLEVVALVLEGRDLFGHEVQVGRAPPRGRGRGSCGAKVCRWMSMGEIFMSASRLRRRVARAGPGLKPEGSG